MPDSKKEVLKILEKNKITNFHTPEDQIKLELKKAKEKKKHTYSKEMQEWIDRQEGYREWRERKKD